MMADNIVSTIQETIDTMMIPRTCKKVSVTNIEASLCPCQILFNFLYKYIVLSLTIIT